MKLPKSMERSWLNTLSRARRTGSWPAIGELPARNTVRNVCIVALVFLFVLYDLALPWTGDGQHQLTDQGEELTVVLNTFKRLDLLQRSVQHYSQCPVVKRIHVNWAESTVTPDLSQETCCDTHVTFAVPLLTHNDSSLNTRFLPIPDLETEAVLNIDDDITVSCDSLLQTFRTWQQHQDQLVGWFPRHVTSALGPAALKYRTHLETLLFDHEYNVVLTKGAIMHRKYLEAYSVDTPQELRDMVAERRNCEDILMQFVISSRTDSLPVFEWDVGVHDSGAGLRPTNLGISQGGSHLQTRSQCVADFSAAFGASPATRSLWTHPDAWLLMISPPLNTLYQLLHGAPRNRKHACRLICIPQGPSFVKVWNMSDRCADRRWHPPTMPQEHLAPSRPRLIVKPIQG